MVQCLPTLSRSTDYNVHMFKNMATKRKHVVAATEEITDNSVRVNLRLVIVYVRYRYGCIVLGRCGSWLQLAVWCEKIRAMLEHEAVDLSRISDNIISLILTVLSVTHRLC